MKKILEAIRDIFPYALLIYLVFFLLEVLLPGFVSNNFDLNYLLVIVLILAFLSVFAPPITQKEEPPKKSDRNLIVILTLLSFLVLFFRTKDMGLGQSLMISLVSAGLVGFMSFIILTEPEEIIPDEDALLEILERLSSRKTVFTTHKVILNLKSKFIIGFLVIGLVVFLFLNKNKQSKLVQESAMTPTLTPTVSLEEPATNFPLPTPDEKILKQTSITILNGTDKIGSASGMAEFLLSKKFVVAKVADADHSDYKNLLIRFRPNEYGVVRYLVDILQGIYPRIVREPLSTDSAEIIMILGEP